MTRQGLCIALASAALFAAAAAPAAADTVGNPGNFGASFGGVATLGDRALGYFDQTLAPLQMGASVGPDGAISGGWSNTWSTDSTLDPPEASGSLSGGNLTWDLSQQHLTMHSGAATGSIDPASGQVSLVLPVYGTLTAHLDYSAFGSGASATISCTEGSADSPVQVPLSTTGSVNSPLGPSPVSAVPYNPADGTVTLVSGAFTSPDPSCSGGGAFGGLSSVIDTIKTELVGSSGAGDVWLSGAFTPPVTAPVPPPPPDTTGTGTTTTGGTGGQQASGGGQTPAPGAASCIVPKLGHSSLSSARRQLGAAHCTLGKVTKRHSTKVKSGRVLSQGSKPGSKLAGGFKVALTVSSGAPKKRRHHR